MERERREVAEAHCERGAARAPYALHRREGESGLAHVWLATDNHHLPGTRARDQGREFLFLLRTVQDECTAYSRPVQRTVCPARQLGLQKLHLWPGEHESGGCCQKTERPQFAPQHRTRKCTGANGAMGCDLDKPKPQCFGSSRLPGQSLKATDEARPARGGIAFKLRLDNKQAAKQAPTDLPGISSPGARRV
jgi:hypothetical protein